MWLLFLVSVSYIYIYFRPSFLLSLHSHCLNIFSDSPYEEIVIALFCGQSLPYGKIRYELTVVQLIHIFVVSGMHLTLIKKCLHIYHESSQRKIQWIETIVLTIYTLITQFQPPVVRALIEAHLNHYLIKEHHKIILSYVLCLVLVPSWIHNFSLELSILARTAIFISQKRSPFFLVLMIHLLLAPILFFSQPWVGFFTFILIYPILITVFSLGLFWIITEWLDHFTYILLLKISTQGVHIILQMIQELKTLFPPLFSKPITWLNPQERMFYISFVLSLVHIYGIKTHRQLWIFSDYSQKQMMSFKKWSVIISLILFFQPIVLNQKKKSTLNSIRKVDIPYLNHEPRVRNKHIHYKR